MLSSWVCPPQWGAFPGDQREKRGQVFNPHPLPTELPQDGCAPPSQIAAPLKVDAQQNCLCGSGNHFLSFRPAGW